MQNHKVCLKHLSLILKIKYHITTTVVIVFNKSYIEQMLHTRLRTECSSLNFYLHLHNLVPSPNCVCGAIENNKHYLLDCHRYVNARDEMLNIIIRYSNVTADILLFGNTDLPVQINEEIFKAVHAYIRKTRRFMS